MSPTTRHLSVGAISGIFGGIVFGLAMTQTGSLPTIAGLVRAEDPVIGFAVHMVVATIIGALFGLLVLHQRSGAGETLFWGASYATFWWFLGALTLLPLFVRGELAWSLASARDALPSLFGHILYGVGTGTAFLMIQRRFPGGGEPHASPSVGTLVQGAAAGAIGGWFLTSLFGYRPEPLAEALPMLGALPEWGLFMGISVLAGLLFSMLYPEPSGSSGVSLIRGTVYGFLWWLLVFITIVPLLDTGAIAWSVDEARARYPLLVGMLLGNCVIAFIYRALDGIGKTLFSERIPSRLTEHGVGARSLQAIVWGSQAGLVGGALFGLVLARLGAFPEIARLVGGNSVALGVVVHLVIAAVFGILYAMLFRGESYEPISALGWGLSYGFFWWLLGSLTLMPLFLGQGVTWSAAEAANSFGSLVGHMLYGAGVAIVHYRLESQAEPWWIPHEAFKERRIQNRIEQLRTASPAIWVEVVILAILLPLLVGG